jgi:hypothetical protein
VKSPIGVDSTMKKQYQTFGPWEVVYRDDENFMSMTCIAPKGSMGSTSNICRLNDDHNKEKVIAITFHQSQPFVGVDDLYRDEMIDIAEANSKLIAAAPELLEALIEVVKISDRKHDAWDKAKAAILKATS